jgi:hypothetical protein
VSHDDPSCLRYDLRVPDRSSSIESYVVGQDLIRCLESRGLVRPTKMLNAEQPRGSFRNKVEGREMPANKLMNQDRRTRS